MSIIRMIAVDEQGRDVRESGQAAARWQLQEHATRATVQLTEATVGVRRWQLLAAVEGLRQRHAR